MVLFAMEDKTGFRNEDRDTGKGGSIMLPASVMSHVCNYGCDSWTIKKAECQKIDAFEL